MIRKSLLILLHLSSGVALQYSWYDRLDQLQVFVRENGHARVPKRSGGSLGLWVSKQRSKRDKLSMEQIEALNQLDFCWNVSQTVSIEDQWWKRFRELQLYNDSLESDKDTLPESLQTWLQRQRKTKLSSEQQQALDELDPLWKLGERDRQWQKQYQNLVAFKQHYGHCSVPISYEDRQLANWVSNQRKIKDKMPRERFRQLKALGFVWNYWEHEFMDNQGYEESSHSVR